MQRNKHDIFISYSRKDLALVRQIKNEIESSTYAHCWMDLNGSDGGVESGSSSFAKAIVDAIENCMVFLFMLSQNSQESFNALRELNYAYDEKDALGIHVVIINIDNCQITNKVFKLLFGPADIISWTDSPQHDKLIGDLSIWVKSRSEYMAKIMSEMTEKARNYLFNKKERKPFYLFSGKWWDEYTDWETSYYYAYTQSEIDNFIQLFIDLYNEDIELADDKAKTLVDVMKDIPLHEFGGSNAEIDKLLERCKNDEMELLDIDPTPRYLYTMSFFFWDPVSKEISNKRRFRVELSDEDYLYLLVEQLLDRKYYSYNRLIEENPELALKICNEIKYDEDHYRGPFLVIFDEVLNDVEAIEGPLSVRVELFFDNKNSKWYRAIASTKGHLMYLEEEKEPWISNILLRDINADEVMKRLEAVDYPDMLIKLKERFYTSTALADIKSWLDAESIAYKEV